MNSIYKSKVPFNVNKNKQTIRPLSRDCKVWGLMTRKLKKTTKKHTNRLVKERNNYEPTFSKKKWIPSLSPTHWVWEGNVFTLTVCPQGGSPVWEISPNPRSMWVWGVPQPKVQETGGGELWVPLHTVCVIQGVPTPKKFRNFFSI